MIESGPVNVAPAFTIHARCRRLKCSVLRKSGSFSACQGYDARTGRSSQCKFVA